MDGTLVNAKNPAQIGFVFIDGTGVIRAAEAGPHLDVGISLPGTLSIAPGAPFCARPVTCAGTAPDTQDMLVFTATTNVAVGPATDGELTIDGRQYLARSLNPVITASQCPTGPPAGEGGGTDPNEGGTFWMISREPLPNSP